jgi:hypothetical protein
LTCCDNFVDIPYNYKNHTSTTTCPSRDELLELRRLCWLYSPVKMESDGHFLKMDNDSPIFNESDNKFITIEASTNIYALGLDEDSAIVAAARRKGSVLIMAYCKNWVDKNYYVPLNELNEILSPSSSSYSSSSITYSYPPTRTSSPPARTSSSNHCDNDGGCTCKKCLIITCIVIIVLVSGPFLLCFF